MAIKRSKTKKSKNLVASVSMALSLIAYFCTMMSALAVFVALLSGVLPPRRFPEPHPVVVAEQATISVNTAVPKITTRVQGVVVDGMASNKEAVVASQKPSSGEVPRHLMRHQLAYPTKPAEIRTALVFHDELFWIYRQSQ